MTDLSRDSISVRTRLDTYEFPLALRGRLMHEHHWPLGHAQRVLEEYRRFLILAATSGRSVTPSVTVDKAWHSHLELTRDYWDELCDRVIGERLHHEPGDPGQNGAFRQQYLETLDLYEQTFGTRAPLAYWPDPRRQKRAPARRGLSGSGRSTTRYAAALIFAALVTGLVLALLHLGVPQTWVWFLGAFLALLAFGRGLRGGGPGERRQPQDDGSLLVLSVIFDGDSSSDSSSDGGGNCSSSCGSSCGGGCSS